MSNWTTIVLQDLYDAKAASIIDLARTLALETGQTDDPSVAAISAAVSRIRSAISTGNDLDVNAAKIPNSLKELGVRMAIRFLKGRVEMELTKQDIDDQRDDLSWLNRMTDAKLVFEQPDNAGGRAEMQERAVFQVVSSSRRQYKQHQTRGLT